MEKNTDNSRMCAAQDPNAGSHETSPCALDRLPTLQRNALRKIFGRSDVLPEEVAALGYRRLQMSEGIGGKGLHTILSWLNDYGYVVTPLHTRMNRVRDEKKQLLLQRAMRIVSANGFEVSLRSERTDS